MFIGLDAKTMFGVHSVHRADNLIQSHAGRGCTLLGLIYHRIYLLL